MTNTSFTIIICVAIRYSSIEVRKRTSERDNYVHSSSFPHRRWSRPLGVPRASSRRHLATPGDSGALVRGTVDDRRSPRYPGLGLVVRRGLLPGQELGWSRRGCYAARLAGLGWLCHLAIRPVRLSRHRPSCGRRAGRRRQAYSLHHGAAGRPGSPRAGEPGARGRAEPHLRWSPGGGSQIPPPGTTNPKPTVCGCFLFLHEIYGLFGGLRFKHP